MSDPLKRPSIEYRQKRAEPAVLPPDTRGDAGLSISVEAAIKTLDALIDEIRDGLVTIKESMRDYAITDRGGELVKAAGRALETDTNPKSVSFHTYQSLASKEAGKAVRNVFEEKSYSAWGNASVALTHALESVRAEARRSRVFLSEGCSDDKLIESIADWAGAARMFVVDAKTIGSSTIDESLISEIDEYRSQALEVQKANVIGAAKLANGIKGALNQIKTLYNDDANVYEELSDIKVRPSITTNGVVGKILGLHKENVDEYRSSRLDDLDYRTEAFSEASQELLTNVAQLKLTQFVTRELAKNGGAIESDVDSIIVTSPDLTYDTKVKPAAEIIPESGVTELEARSLIDNSIEDLRIETQALISDGSTAEWHTVTVHEGLGFSTKENNDLLYSDIGHNHDSDYSDIDHNHDSAYSAADHNHDSTYSSTGHDHDSDYAPIASGVTNGDSHNHVGGDGASIPFAGISTEAWTSCTPAVSATSGSFTSASATGRYTRIGNVVFFVATVTITTVGTGSGVNVALPVNAATSMFQIVGGGRESASTGKTVNTIITNASNLWLTLYDGTATTPSNGHVYQIYCTYEAA